LGTTLRVSCLDLLDTSLPAGVLAEFDRGRDSLQDSHDPFWRDDCGRDPIPIAECARTTRGLTRGRCATQPREQGPRLRLEDHCISPSREVRKTTFEELAGSIGRVAPQAATAGVSVQAMLAAISTMTRSGLKTEESVVRLNAIIKTFTTATDEQKKAAARFGLQLDETAIKGEGLLTAMEKLAGLSLTELGDIFADVRGVGGASILAGNVAGLRKDIELLTSAGGARLEAFTKVQDTVTLAWARVREGGKSFIVAVLMPLAPMLAKLGKWFADNAETVVGWGKKVGEAIRAYVVGVVGAYTTVEFAITHWRDTFKLHVLAARLGFISITQNAKWALGVQIPQLLQWFQRNWRNIFTDLWRYTKTVFSNLFQNVVNIVTSLPELISGSLSWSDVWTPLTDGFEATLEELPKLAKRQLTDTEKELGKQIRALGGDMFEGWKEELADRLRRFGLISGGAGPETPPSKETIESFTKAGAGTTAGPGAPLGMSGAAERGRLSALESRFLHYAPGADIASRTERNTFKAAQAAERTETAQKQTNDLLQRLIAKGLLIYSASV